jgi:ribosomal protein S18 acetylase RimI-like enzyme
VGLTDVEYDTEIGEICFQKDSLGGYVLEFGRLPEYGKQGIGKLLMDATVEAAKKQGTGAWSIGRRSAKRSGFMRG